MYPPELEKRLNIQKEIKGSFISIWSSIQQGFLLIFTIRITLFSLILAVFYQHPLMQATMILILNIMMIIYIYIKAPLKNAVNKIQQICYEHIFLCVNFSVTGLAGLDQSKQLLYEQEKLLLA